MFHCDAHHKSTELVPAIRVNDLIPDCPFGTDEPIYHQITYSTNDTARNECAAQHLPCLHLHPKCFPSHKLCIYELDMQHQMMHCRNGFHVKSCDVFPCSQAYKCASSYCIPLQYVCDGEWHCPNGEDEQHCTITFTPVCTQDDVKRMAHKFPPFVYHNFLSKFCMRAIIPRYEPTLESMSNQLSCPGLFRCQYGQCLHPSLLCDGAIHCPLFADDETSCVASPCPAGCRCVGKAVYCVNSRHRQIPDMPRNTHALVFTHNSRITIVDSLQPFSQLLKVDFSYNKIAVILDSVMLSLVKLLHLDVSHNRLREPPHMYVMHSLLYLNISHNLVDFLAADLFHTTPNLKVLDLSSNNLHHLLYETFSTLEHLVFFFPYFITPLVRLIHS